MTEEMTETISVVWVRPDGREAVRVEFKTPDEPRASALIRSLVGLRLAISTPDNTAAEHFEGEWVAVPKEDFDKLRNAFARALARAERDRRVDEAWAEYKRQVGP